MAVMGLLLLGLMRQVGSIVLQITPPRPGEIEGGPPLDNIVRVPGVPRSKPPMIIFASPTCKICEFLPRAIPSLVKSYPEIEVVVAVVEGDAAQRSRYATAYGKYGRTDLGKLFASWDVPGTPFAVGIDEEHRVRKTGVVNNLDQLETLAEFALLTPRFAGENEGDAMDEIRPDITAPLVIGADPGREEA